MRTRAHAHHPIVGVTWNPSHIALTILLTLLFLIFVTLTTQPAQGQTFTVLYSLTYPADGWSPTNVAMDTAGNLYGTTTEGGYTGGDCQRYSGCGPAFKLSRQGSNWTFRTIHDFSGDVEGA